MMLSGLSERSLCKEPLIGVVLYRALQWNLETPGSASTQVLVEIWSISDKQNHTACPSPVQSYCCVRESTGVWDKQWEDFNPRSSVQGYKSALGYLWRPWVEHEVRRGIDPWMCLRPLQLGIGQGRRVVEVSSRDLEATLELVMWEGQCLVGITHWCLQTEGCISLEGHLTFGWVCRRRLFVEDASGILLVSFYQDICWKKEKLGILSRLPKPNCPQFFFFFSPSGSGCI